MIEERHAAPEESSVSTRAGPTICVLLIAIVASAENGVMSTSVGNALSVLVIALGVVWAGSGPGKLRHLSEFYLWLAFILPMYHLEALARALAGSIERAPIDVFRPVGVVHVLVVVAALWALGAWSRDRRQKEVHARTARFAAGLFIVGAVVFWVGARTFPGMALENVHADSAAHLWTSINFMLATGLTVAALALFMMVLREAGDRLFSTLGLLGFTFGAVLWTPHLVFRLSVMVVAAEEWNRTSLPPAWYEPWRVFASLLFGTYSAVAYISLAAYGVALIKTRWLPRWAGWICVFAGLAAAPRRVAALYPRAVVVGRHRLAKAKRPVFFIHGAGPGFVLTAANMRAMEPLSRPRLIGPQRSTPFGLALPVVIRIRRSSDGGVQHRSGLRLSRYPGGS